MIEAFCAQLEQVRYGILKEGGGSIVYPLCVFRGLLDLALFAPKAVAIAFFSPFPSDWIIQGRAGWGANIFGAINTFALYLLFPYGVIGAWTIATRQTR